MAPEVGGGVSGARLLHGGRGGGWEKSGAQGALRVRGRQLQGNGRFSFLNFFVFFLSFSFFF